VARSADRPALVRRGVRGRRRAVGVDEVIRPIAQGLAWLPDAGRAPRRVDADRHCRPTGLVAEPASCAATRYVRCVTPVRPLSATTSVTGTITRTGTCAVSARPVTGPGARARAAGHRRPSARRGSASRSVTLVRTSPASGVLAQLPVGHRLARLPESSRQWKTASTASGGMPRGAGGCRWSLVAVLSRWSRSRAAARGRCPGA
jgi:hypothetical protein